MNLRSFPLGLLAVLAGAGLAHAQTIGGSGGAGGNATVNIYGGTIYLTPQGGEGGAGGSARGGGGAPRGAGVQPGIDSGAAGGPSLWNHNGSTMRLVAEGARRKFFYMQPRPGIRAAGAAPGTLLFDGVRRGESYSGTAYVFAGNCGSFPYKVSGRLASETEVVMSGMAPSVSRDSCSVEGYRQDTLVFNYLQAQ